jgi:hypothetical protein
MWLRTQKAPWIFWFHKTLGILWLAEYLQAFHELCYALFSITLPYETLQLDYTVFMGWLWKNLEGDATVLHLLGEAGEKVWNLQPGYPVSRPRIEPKIWRMRRTVLPLGPTRFDYVPCSLLDIHRRILLLSFICKIFLYLHQWKPAALGWNSTKTLKLFILLKSFTAFIFK